MGHRSPQGSLCQHCPLWWYDHVPRYRRSYAEGDHRLGFFHHEDQDHRSSREEVLRLDRRLHLGFPLHLPGDVDLQEGVRRGWTRNCPPKMLLDYVYSVFDAHQTDLSCFMNIDSFSSFFFSTIFKKFSFEFFMMKLPNR